MLHIDIVLRTYNRAHRLEGAIDSLFAADSTGITRRLIIVDNNSTDSTAAVIAAAQQRYGADISSCVELRPGGQHALNRGIADATAPIVAFFDDDEHVTADWLQVIAREMADLETGYIAGPVRPLWDGEAPDWIPPGYGGVLSIIDSGPVKRAFGSEGFSAMLTQGNCAIRRTLLDTIGPYPDALPTAEDAWMGDQLTRLQVTGYYCPDLVVAHCMQADRLKPDYFRQWARREGRDRAVVDQMAGRTPKTRQPWFWRKLAEDCAGYTKARLTGARDARALLLFELDILQAAIYIKTRFTGG
jgi:glycosyltransferase involved in cell wall biosynthesis